MSAVDLDSEEVRRRLDPGDMYPRVEELSQQMEEAWRLAGELDLPERFRSVRSVLLAGMGGSAIGGSLIEAFAGQDLRVPFAVWRNYGLPAWAGPDTLVVGVSYSGNTEETRSALEE